LMQSEVVLLGRSAYKAGEGYFETFGAIVWKRWTDCQKN